MTYLESSSRLHKSTPLSSGLPGVVAVAAAAPPVEWRSIGSWFKVVNWNCPLPAPASNNCWVEAWLADKWPCCCWIRPPGCWITETKVEPCGLDADITLEGGRADRVKVWGPPPPPCNAWVFGEARATETRFPAELGIVIYNKHKNSNMNPWNLAVDHLSSIVMELDYNWISVLEIEIFSILLVGNF